MEELYLCTCQIERTGDIPVLLGAALVPNRDIPNGGDVKVEQMGFEFFQLAKLLQRGVSHNRIPPYLNLFTILGDPR